MLFALKGCMGAKAGVIMPWVHDRDAIWMWYALYKNGTLLLLLMTKPQRSIMIKKNQTEWKAVKEKMRNKRVWGWTWRFMKDNERKKNGRWRRTRRRRKRRRTRRRRKRRRRMRGGAGELRRKWRERRKVDKILLTGSLFISHFFYFFFVILIIIACFLSSSSSLCFLFLIHELLFIITTIFVKSILFLLELPFFSASIYIFVNSWFLTFLLGYNQLPISLVLPILAVFLLSTMLYLSHNLCLHIPPFSSHTHTHTHKYWTRYMYMTETTPQ